MGTLLLILVGLIVSLSACGILQTRYETAVHRVRLEGPLAEPADWLPEAMGRAARGGLTNWSFEISPVLDDGGDLLGFHAVLRSDLDDTVLVDVPHFPAGDYTGDPVIADVVIGTYTISSLRGANWFGLPALHVRRRWRRVRRQLRKHSRGSALHR